MRVLILLFACMLALSACQWGETAHQKPDINFDTLVFTYDTIKIRAPDCGDKADSACTVALIIYPKFTAQKALNDTLAKKIMTAGFNSPDKKRDTSLKSFASNFISGYLKDNPKQYSPDMFYTLNVKAILIRQDSSLTTLQVDGCVYEGGAHAARSTSFINWNTKLNKVVTLSDILIEGYYDKLTAIGDTIFRRQEKLSDTSSLTRDYKFAKGRFSLNENYSITPLGIRIVYNEYEIKPYAAGTTNLFIPYTKIKLLLRPNTVVTQYIK